MSDVDYNTRDGWHAKQLVLENCDWEEGKGVYDSVVDYFNTREHILGEHSCLSLRILLSKEVDIFFIDSKDFGPYIAVVQPQPNRNEVYMLDVELIFPDKDERRESMLVEEIRRTIAERQRKLKPVAGEQLELSF